MASYSLADKQYWIYTVEAAQQAITRAVELSEGATNKWDNIVKDGLFEHLSTSIPIPTERSTSTEPVSRRTKSPQTQHRGQSTVQPATKQTVHKKQSNKMKTGVQLTKLMKAYGSLKRHQSQRTRHISRDVIAADLTGVGKKRA